jgi:hypothetical protein
MNRGLIFRISAEAEANVNVGDLVEVELWCARRPFSSNGKFARTVSCAIVNSRPRFRVNIALTDFATLITVESW